MQPVPDYKVGTPQALCQDDSLRRSKQCYGTPKYGDIHYTGVPHTRSWKGRG